MGNVIQNPIIFLWCASYHFRSSHSWTFAACTKRRLANPLWPYALHCRPSKTQSWQLVWIARKWFLLRQSSLGILPCWTWTITSMPGCLSIFRHRASYKRSLCHQNTQEHSHHFLEGIWHPRQGFSSSLLGALRRHRCHILTKFYRWRLATPSHHSLLKTCLNYWSHSKDLGLDRGSWYRTDWTFRYRNQ